MRGVHARLLGFCRTLGAWAFAVRALEVSTNLLDISHEKKADVFFRRGRGLGCSESMAGFKVEEEHVGSKLREDCVVVPKIVSSSKKSVYMSDVSGTALCGNCMLLLLNVLAALQSLQHCE